MGKVKGKKQGVVDSGVFDTFISLNDLAQIACVLTATEKLSELAAEMDAHFGEVEICRGVIREVRSVITSIHAMGGVLYSVPIARRLLHKYDVKLSTWTRFKMGARFYSRSVVVMWILASILSAAAAALLVARFAVAAYGVAMGTVPVAALGYLAAAIAGVCLPLAACGYMLRQIKFAYEKFVESVKIAKIIAHERVGMGVIDEQEDHLPSAYFSHSISDYDVRKSKQLVWSSSICLAVSVLSLCLAFSLDAFFPLKGVGASTASAVAPSLALWYDFVVVGLSFMVGALLMVFGSSQFLHDGVALAQLKKAILETVDAEVLLRDDNIDLAARKQASDDVEKWMDPGSAGTLPSYEGPACCAVGGESSDLVVVSIAGKDIHEASVVENSYNDRIASFSVSNSPCDRLSASGREEIEEIQNGAKSQHASDDECTERKAAVSSVDGNASAGGAIKRKEKALIKDESAKEHDFELLEVVVESAHSDVEQQRVA